MRRLTILSERHEEIIRARLWGNDEREWIVRAGGHRDGKFFTRLSYTPGAAFTETMTDMLEDAAVTDNDAYRESSERMMENVRALRASPVRAENERRMREFLAANGTLNFEGYLTFAMEDYSAGLDAKAYELIKRVLKNKVSLLL